MVETVQPYYANLTTNGGDSTLRLGAHKPGNGDLVAFAADSPKQINYELVSGDNREWGIGTVYANGDFTRDTIEGTVVSGDHNMDDPGPITVTAGAFVLWRSVAAEDLIDYTDELAGIQAAAANVDAIEDAFDVFTSNMDDLLASAANIDAYETAAAAAKSNIDDLETAATTAAGNIDSLEESATSAAGNIDDLEISAGNAASNIDDLEVSATAAAANIDSLEGAAETIVATMGGLEATAAADVVTIGAYEGTAGDLLDDISTIAASANDAVNGAMGAISGNEDTAIIAPLRHYLANDDDPNWPKRCRWTSGYNEALGTATRGTRREFPAVADIEATASSVTIRDATQPGRPMEMVFNAAVGNMLRGDGTAITSIAMRNGMLVVGQGGAGFGVQVIYFIKDRAQNFRASAGGTGTYKLPLSGRNSGTPYPGDASTAFIVNNIVNRVAVTCLPGADTDPETGMRYVSILVCTAAGASIINRAGTTALENDVIDLTGAVNLIAGDIGSDGFIIVASSTKLYVFESMPTSDTALTSATYTFDTAGSSGPHIGGTISGVKLMSSDGSGNAEFIVNTSDGVFLVNYVSGGTGSLVAEMNGAYVTPYMKGDVELCLVDGLTDRSVAGTAVADAGSVVVAAAYTGSDQAQITATGGDLTATVTTGGAIYGWEKVSGVWQYRQNTGWVGVSESGGTLTIADGTTFANLVYVNGAAPSAAQFATDKAFSRVGFSTAASRTLPGTPAGHPDYERTSDTSLIATTGGAAFVSMATGLVFKVISTANSDLDSDSINAVSLAPDGGYIICCATNFVYYEPAFNLREGR